MDMKIKSTEVELVCYYSVINIFTYLLFYLHFYYDVIGVLGLDTGLSIAEY